jgi:hypothetical protein
LLLVVAASALLWRLRVVGSQSVAIDWWGNSDQYDYFYPVYRLAAERLKHGHLPLWNPNQLAGEPFLATAEVAVFYPPNLLHLVLPIERSMQVLAFGHLLLASVLVYWLCRVLDISREASAIGGIGYAWSSYVVGAHLWPPYLAVLTWFPLPLIGIALIHRERVRLGTSCLALGTALILLTGSFPIAFFGVQATGAYAAWNVTRRWRGGSAREIVVHVSILGLAVTAGVLLSAAQLAPALELVRLASRNPGGLTPEQIEPLGVLTPDIFWRLFAPAIGGSGYPGTAILLLLPAALLKSRLRSEALFFLTLAIVFALLSLGSATPLFTLYCKLPGADMVRYPGRAMCLFTLGACVVAAIGADNLLAHTPRALAQRWQAPALVVAFAAILRLLDLHLPVIGLVSSALVLAACALLPGRWQRVGLIVTCCVLVADLALVPPTQDVQIWQPGALDQLHLLRSHYEKLAPQLGQGRVLVSPSWAFVATAPRVVAMHGLRVFENYEPLSMQRYADYATYLQHGRLYSPGATKHAYGGKLEDAGILHRRLLAAAGVRAIAHPGGYPGMPPQLDVDWIAGALPRAYLVHGLRSAKNPAATLRSLARGALGRNLAALEGLPPAAAMPPSALSLIERVRILNDEPERVRIEAVVERAAALILLDTDYPGWHASVDGKAARIYNANYLFRAVLLGPGRHRVTFRYAPQSVYLGLELACAGALLLTVFCAGYRPKSRVAAA